MSNGPVDSSANEIQQSSRAVGLKSLQVCWKSLRGKPRVENSCMCGLFSCETVEQMWAQGGSLALMDGENLVIESRASYGDCLRLISVEGTIKVTDLRFIVKKMFKIGPCNIQAEEASHHFANLQHVGVERGLNFEESFATWIAVRVLLTLSIILFAVGQAAVGAVLMVLFGIYGLYRLAMILINWNTNFLVIDVARENVIGTWNWGVHTSARSYLTIRVPLRIEDCFNVSKALLKKHPLLPSPQAQV